MTRTLPLANALDLFDRKNLACQIPDSRTGTLTFVSEGRRNILRTYVRSAVARAAGVHPKDPALVAVDLLPILAVLPEMAHRDATLLGRTNPANEASGVRTFLRAVTGDKIAARSNKRPVRPESFLPAWRPLADELWRSSEGKSGRFDKYAGWLETFQNILLLNGVRRPQDVPGYATVAAWVAAYVEAHAPDPDPAKPNAQTIEETVEKRRSDYFTAYRKARDLLGNPADLPELERPRREHERGVQALPGLMARLEASAATLRAQSVEAQHPLPTARAETLALLDLLAPEFAKATRMYIEWTKTDAVRSEAWREQVVAAASNVVAELIRIGEDPIALDYPDLFLQTRQVAKTTPAKAVGLKRGVKLEGCEELPLFRVVLDAAAKRSFAHSPLTLPPQQAAAAVPLYTPAVFNDFAAAWAVTDIVYGKQLCMETQSPTEWREIERIHERIAEHMKEYNDSREMEGHKDKTLVTANWGQAVCVGGSILWRRARELRSVWKAAGAKHGAESPAVDRARRSYSKALNDYVLWVVLLDDGLRIANYAGARMGKHFRLTTQLVDGQRRVTGVLTRFRGYDAEAPTKKRRKAGGRQNVRRRTLNPGVVDLELFTDFVNVSRVDALASAGLLASREAYDPETDTFAVFVSPQSTRVHGGYLRSRLSKRFGRLLHWLTRDVLGHRDDDGRPIPSWRELQRSKALRQKFRAIWNAHPLRQIVATFMLGVLKDETTACRLTNDTPATLANFYNQFDENLAELLKGPRGIHHPEHFAEVCRRLLRGDIVDWATFDPQHPELARWVTQHAPLPAPRRRRSRRPQFVAI